jgi:hypothetical protein
MRIEDSRHEKNMYIVHEGKLGITYVLVKNPPKEYLTVNK